MAFMSLALLSVESPEGRHCPGGLEMTRSVAATWEGNIVPGSLRDLPHDARAAKTIRASRLRPLCLPAALDW